jgi:hypothetical protein
MDDTSLLPPHAPEPLRATRYNAPLRLLRRSLLISWVAALPSAHAQTPGDSIGARCDGEIVQRIDIQTDRPPFSGASAKWRAAARAIGLHHATTQAQVIAAFLSVHEGEPCTEFRLVESERVLRAQSFISEARVTATHDSLGRLIIDVHTSDEIPALLAARFHGVGLPEALSLGNANIGGSGILADIGAEQAEGYRVGVGGRFISATAFGRPYRLTIDGDRARIGSHFQTEFEHPLFTDIQHVAWHLSYQTADDYPDVLRLASDPLALEIKQERWEANGIARVFGVKTISVLGLGLSRVHIVPADTGILVTPFGLQPDTGTVLRNRYQPFLVTRAGVIAGVRHVRFIPVKGFDALFATQDVPSGFMLGVFAAKSLPSLGERDAFLSSAAYVGAASPHAMAAMAVEAEGRRDDSNQWDSMIESGRAAVYLKNGNALGFTLGDEFSGGTRSRLPLQLSLGDLQGGMRGYGGANLAGAQRNVVRADLRRSSAAAVRGTDIGVALFGEVGTLWAGDAPYGVSTTRESVGISLLAAYPTRSKRTYRLDVGLPLDRTGTGGLRRVEFRVTSEDRTDRFWREPDDVSRARTGAVPSSLFSWQNP